MNIELIDKQLRSILTIEKYEHSKRVADVAYRLAEKLGMNGEEAYIAGLLHDCAKSLNDSEILEMAIEKGITITAVRRLKPVKYLHAFVGEHIAGERFGITNRLILQAVKYHEEGGIDMTHFDKIIAISDMIEPNRKFKDIDEIKMNLATDIDEAYYIGYKNIIMNYVDLNLPLEDDRIRIYNSLLLLREKRRSA